MRVIATFTIYGNHKQLAPLIDRFMHVDVALRQIGLNRKVPALDDWCIYTPYFTIDIKLFDNEIRRYISYLRGIFDFSLFQSHDNLRTTIYIIPVQLDMLEEQFYGVLEPETITELAGISCALEISPASIMPESRELP
jgi:hypothetical protein